MNRPHQLAAKGIAAIAGLAAWIALAGGAGSATGASGPPADLVHFHRVSVADSMMQGAEAFTLLAPVDWKTSGGVVWDTQNLAAPAGLNLRVSSPSGDQQIAFYPTLSFYWSSNPMVQRAQPRGSRYLGALVQPVVSDCKTALARVAWPLTQGKVAGAKIVAFNDLPDYASAYEAQLPQGSGVAFTLRAGRLRVQYPDPGGGPAVQQDLIAVLLIIPNPQTQSTNWLIDNIISFKSNTGNLDNDEKKMEVISSSLRPNIQWFAGYQQAQQTVVDMARTNSNAAFQRAQIRFQAQQQINAMQQEAFQRRENAIEKSNAAWDRIIRGVQLYQTPDGRKVELPNDYNHAWTNGNGDYMMSNSGFYNPSADFPGTWQEINPIAN
jgi:hypothetical protein